MAFLKKITFSSLPVMLVISILLIRPCFSEKLVVPDSYKTISAKIVLDTIPLDSIPMGCSFLFWNFDGDGKNQYLFEKKMNSDNLRFICNGKNQVLKQLSSKVFKKDSMQYSLGDSSTETYANEQYQVVLKYKTIKVCPESNPDCASTEYYGEIELVFKTEKLKLKLHGELGC